MVTKLKMNCLPFLSCLLIKFTSLPFSQLQNLDLRTGTRDGAKVWAQGDAPPSS